MNFWKIDNIASVLGATWLQRPATNLELDGIGTDTRENLRNKLFMAISGDRFDGHDFLPEAVMAGAAALLVERDCVAPSVPKGIGILKVAHSRQAMARLALAYRRSLCDTTVIAVAGSAGKTTTKKLIDAVLRKSMPGSISPKSFNNDIGVPLTILNARPEHRYLVVEVGTNALGEVGNLATMIEPDVAIITMIGREHLEGLISLEHVAAENAALLDSLQPNGVAIVNADAPLLRGHLKRAPSVVLFGESVDATLRLTGRGKDTGGWWFDVNNEARFGLSLPGKHNAINALAAVAVARRMQVSDEDIGCGLQDAEGAPMRSSIEQIGSVMVYNDAYNANPESMRASLETFAEIASDAKRRILILGDMLELGPEAAQMHREFAGQILRLDREVSIDWVAFIGEHSSNAAEVIEKEWGAARVSRYQRLDEHSCREIARRILPGDAILLKGSRGMRLEQLLPSIESQLRAAETTPPAKDSRSRAPVTTQG